MGMKKPKAAKPDPELARAAQEAKNRAKAEAKAAKDLQAAEEAARQNGLRGIRALAGGGARSGFLGAAGGTSLLA
jgi:hypothetical protein